MRPKIEIVSVFDSFWLELEVEVGSPEKRSCLSPDCLAESLRWAIHLW
jgi:hypothetical protein